MKKTKILFILLIIISLIFFSCSKDSTGPNGGPKATENWNIIIDDGDGNGTWKLELQPDSTIISTGSWTFGYEERDEIICNFVSSPIVLNGTDFTLNANGTAQYSGINQDSDFTMTCSGSMFNGIGNGIYSIDFDNQYWTDANGTWAGNLIDGEGITLTGTDDNPPNPPSSPYPQDNASSVSINSNLTWFCSDPDNDPLTYEIYFGVSASPPLVNSGQSETIYYLGTLNEETTYYWKIVAKDNHDNSTIGNIWEFTTRTVYQGNFEWCTIPAGEYTYGSGDEILSINYDYQIMKFEVSNEQYVDYLEEAYNAGEITLTDSRVEGYYNGDMAYGAGVYKFLSLGYRINWDGLSFSIESGYENHPVVYITYFGALAFAEHYDIYLPSKYEWQKAARGNTGYDYPWGDYIDGSRANYYDSGDPWDNGTTPVGMYNGQLIQGFQTTDSPSPYGVYDQSGNIMEWTSTIYSYESGARYAGGGNWDDNSVECWRTGPYYPTACYSLFGFRCVRQLSRN